MGDLLFRRWGAPIFPGGNTDTLRRFPSKEQIFVLPDETVVYSGHGPHTTGDKTNNPYAGSFTV